MSDGCTRDAHARPAYPFDHHTGAFAADPWSTYRELRDGSWVPRGIGRAIADEAALVGLIAAADPPIGTIVNIASIAGETAFATQADYCGAKAAVLGFTRGAALDLMGHDGGVMLAGSMLGVDE